jgi:nickel ABC transporter nickel/metallophore binding protein
MARLPRSFKFLSLFFAMILLVIGCNSPVNTTSQPSPSGSTAPTAKTEQIFKVAIVGDVSKLNPQGYDNHGFIPLAMIFDPLVRYSEDGKIQPGLAESWQLSPDSLTLTFKLRKGVTFQDGTPFDATAAKWNFDRWINVADHDWLPISTKIAAINTPDPKTLVLQFKEPYYAALQELSLVRPVRFLSPKSVDATGKFAKPIGTGAYALTEAVKDKKLVFTRNETYWGEKPTISKVEFDVIPDGQTRVAALLSKEVDMIGGEYLGGIPLESIAMLQSNPEVEVTIAEGTTTYLVRLNYLKAPFDSVQVRQALNYAVNREALSSQVFKNLATPAKGFFPPSIPYINYPKPELYSYKPEEAKKLLEAAGWKAGSDGIRAKDGQPLNLIMLVNNDLSPQSKPMAEVIQANLKTVGVNLQLRSVDDGAMIEAIKKGNFDMTLGLSYGSPYDPHSSVKDFFASTKNNDDRYYTDPQLDQLIDQVLKTTTESDRQAQYSKIWQYMDDQAVAVPVLFSKRIYAVNKNVKGFKLAGTEYELNLQGVTIGG